MQDYSIRDARAKLGEIVDRIKDGEIISIKGIEIGLVHSGTHSGTQSGTQMVHTMSDEDVNRLGQKVADIVLAEQNTHVVELKNFATFVPVTESTLAGSKVADHGVVPEPENTREVQYVMVEKWRVDPDCFADEMNTWVKWPAANVAKGVPTRPYVEGLPEELAVHDVGVTMKPRAKMNDGSNPNPKPVSKKKK